MRSCHPVPRPRTLLVFAVSGRFVYFISFKIQNVHPTRPPDESPGCRSCDSPVSLVAKLYFEERADDLVVPTSGSLVEWGNATHGEKGKFI